MSRYLITGGAGFIGSNIAIELLRQKQEVVLLDNMITGRKENILEISDKAEFIEGDIRDINIVKKACENVDYVLHQAALPSVQKSIENPVLTNDININGTLNVLEAARDAKVKRVVYAASSSAYGDTVTLPKIEDMKINPISPYAVSKVVGELYCRVYSQVFGLDTVSIRYFNVFGPRQDPKSHYAAVIPKFIKAVLNDKNPIIYGDGEQTRDFTYIKNVVNANILAARTERPLNGEVINVACGKRIDLNQLVEKLNSIIGKNIEPVYEDERAGDIKHSLADISKAKRLINYSPIYDIDEGLKETVEWYENE